MAEKSEYIQGELCLMSEPAKAGIPGAVTRWDELQYAHIAQASYVHGVVFSALPVGLGKIAYVARGPSYRSTGIS